MRNLGGAAAGAFEDFVVGFDGFGLPKDDPQASGRTGPLCLADYIATWLTEGEGLRVCCENRVMFLEAVVAIIVAWIADSELLYYVTDSDPETGRGRIIPRTVDSVLGEDGFNHRILEPYWFERTKIEARRRQET